MGGVEVKDSVLVSVGRYFVGQSEYEAEFQAAMEMLPNCTRCEAHEFAVQACVQWIEKRFWISLMSRSYWDGVFRICDVFEDFDRCKN